MVTLYHCYAGCSHKETREIQNNLVISRLLLISSLFFFCRSLCGIRLSQKKRRRESSHTGGGENEKKTIKIFL